MCGIAGWVAYDRDLTCMPETIDAMTATMACRGPDAAGTWIRPHVALGHRRLAVIDLPGGKQPMSVTVTSGAVSMVYSGEVYNYVELRKQLEACGHRFTTDSDTEVVLRGYLEWGEDVAEELNGMFAFAIWDERDEKLVMIRDRVGIKPLYYFITRDGVLFGSEPKAILANPLSERTVDTQGLHELFTGARLAGRSVWKDFYEVRPGQIVTVKVTGVRHRTYWTLPTKPHTDDRQKTIETVREIMADTIGRQLVADVPHCVLLSGGLDSSAITGFAAKHLAQKQEPLHTVAVDFDGHAEAFTGNNLQLTPDAPFAQDVANFVGSLHHDVVLSTKELADPAVRRAVITARDAPGLGELDASLYLLFQAIARDATVALSGESADELFGGYHWFHNGNAYQANTFPWYALHSQSPIPRRARARGNILHPDVADKVDLPGYVADHYATAVAGVEQIEGVSDAERHMRTVCYLALTQYMRQWLDRKDRISMAVGLEVRVPYCDHRLIEYVYNVPWSIKTFDGREKSLLRHAAKSVVPQSVVQRTKSGFPMTQNPEYVRELQQQARDALANRHHPAFDLIDRTVMKEAANLASGLSTEVGASAINQLLELYHWIDIYKPTLRLD